MDRETTLQELKDLVQVFCEDRAWDPFHNPKDLAIGIITEAAELLELFRFKSKRESEAMLLEPETRNQVAQELSDILYFTLRIAQRYDFDLTTDFSLLLTSSHEPTCVEHDTSSRDLKSFRMSLEVIDEDGRGHLGRHLHAEVDTNGHSETKAGNYAPKTVCDRRDHSATRWHDPGWLCFSTTRI